MLDLAYRVNSAYATSKKLPRDIVIQLTTVRKKEEILKQHFETLLEIDNRQILVLKEIPKKKALNKRKRYKELTDYVKGKNIYYIWELPEGLSFQFKGKRQTLKTMEQMDNFLEYAKMAEDKKKLRNKAKDGEQVN